MWFGLKGTLNGARMFSWAFAIGYGLLGIAGMAFGRFGTPALHDMPADPKLLTVIPGFLELGRNDHVLHIILAVVFVAAAVLARPVTRSATEQRAAH